MKADNIKIDIWEYLKGTSKPIVLYGMGNGADKILNQFEKRKIAVKGVFASDGFVRDKIYRGFKIKSYLQMKSELGSFIVIVAFGSQLPNVIENIIKIGNEQELYAIDVPVYDDLIFDLNYYQNKRDKFQELYNRLEDEQSKINLDNIISFKLTGKIEYLIDSETNEEEILKILGLSNQETYFDLGAYRGDTAFKFINAVGSYEKIVAVEPDKKTFKKLVENVSEIRNIECVNAGIGENDGVAEFNMSGDRNAHLGKGETVEIKTVDSLSKGNKPTFIKMDIEGNELSAINGAKITIKALKPKMQIAAYHKTEDLLTLSNRVLELNENYKVYLRHFKYIPAWDINFYFV